VPGPVEHRSERDDDTGERGLSPVIGVVALLAVTVALAAVLGTGVFTIAGGTVGPPPTASFSLAAGTDGVVTLTHRGGDTLDVAALTVRVSVDGTALTHQPPVPFFAARGFRAGPTGPFNRASDGRWAAGERAGFRVAGTNSPQLREGARLRVRLWTDGQPVASVSTRVTQASSGSSVTPSLSVSDSPSFSPPWSVPAVSASGT
jgi:flagellin-like protein